MEPAAEARGSQSGPSLGCINRGSWREERPVWLQLGSRRDVAARGATEGT